MSKDWTHRLPDLLEGYTEAAPEGLWDAVQAGVVAPRKRRGAVVWWSAAALVAAAAAILLLVFLPKPAPLQPEVLPVPENRLVQGAAPELPTAPLPGTPPAAAFPKAFPEIHSEAVPEAATDAALDVIPEVTPEMTPEVTPKVASEVTSETEGPESLPHETEPQHPVRPDRPTPGANPKIHPGAKPRLQFTVTSGAYLAQAGSAVTQGYGISANPGMPMLSKAIGSNPISVPMLRRNQASTTESRHRQSLRLAVGVSYNFTDRWSVASGLSYTVLRSDYNTVSGETATYSTRHLHYLGIPLSLQWKALEWKRLSLYLNAGPMWETAVGARLGSRSYVGAALSSEQAESPSVRDSRWSLNAGVGIQYQLFRRGALFLQPGLSWHIPQADSPESYYTVHPLSPDFSFGYRFTF